MIANKPKNIKTSQLRKVGLNQMKRFEQSSKVSKQCKLAHIKKYIYF